MEADGCFRWQAIQVSALKLNEDASFLADSRPDHGCWWQFNFFSLSLPSLLSGPRPATDREPAKTTQANVDILLNIGLPP